MRTILERPLPTTLTLGSGQPEPQEVTPRCRRRVVGVSGSRVENMCIGDELNVTDLEDHVQRQPLRGLLEHLDRFKLFLRVTRNQPSFNVPPDRLDKVWVVMRKYLAVVKVKDRLLNPSLLSVRDLALAVKIPIRLNEQLGDVGTFRLERVPQVVRRDNIRLASLFRLVQAKQANDIGRVGVKELSSCRRVNAHLVDLRRVVAQIFDMAKDVTFAILTERVTKQSTNGEVDGGRLFDRPRRDRKSFNQDEALAVDDE